MSKPRAKWWGYMKNVIREYPKLKKRYRVLHTPSVSAKPSGLPSGRGAPSNPTEETALRELSETQQRELDAVEKAITQTKRLPDGPDRLRLIQMVFWDRSHNLEGAAMALYISKGTALRWHGQFIHLVARCYGLD